MRPLRVVGTDELGQDGTQVLSWLLWLSAFVRRVRCTNSAVRESRGSPFVLVDGTTEPIAANDVTDRPDRLALCQRCGQPERLVRPRAVVVINVRMQHLFEVPPTGHEHPIQALPPYRPLSGPKTLHGSGCAFVAVVEAAEHRAHADRPGPRARERLGRLQAQATMRRRVPTRRSAIAFARGARTGVSTVSMPIRRARRAKSAP